MLPELGKETVKALLDVGTEISKALLYVGTEFADLARMAGRPSCIPARVAALRDSIVGGNCWSIAQDAVGKKN